VRSSTRPPAPARPRAHIAGDARALCLLPAGHGAGSGDGHDERGLQAGAARRGHDDLVQLPDRRERADFRYPANLGIVTSGLGVASCPEAALEAHGPSVCPPDSRMGSGNALVEIPIGSDVVRETTQVALLAGPSDNGYVHILASVTGESPVAARVILSTQLQPGLLQIPVPPIPSLPEAPYVAVIRMHFTIGGQLVYYERIHGHSVAYHPVGIGLPRSCPRGGFPFAAGFSFLDGEQAQAQTAVACPTGR
jgi:hypothetical protein